MGGLAELDFSLMWSDNRCILKDDEGRQIDVTVVNGCPMVTQAEGRRILEWLEFFQVHQKRKMAMVQKMITAPEEVDKSQLDLELAMTLKLRMMFPNLPEEIMMKVVPRLEAVKYEGFGSMLPWNRRKRRRLARAKNIVMHVFSGDNPQFWERRLSTATTEVLCIDIQGGCSANLMDKQLWLWQLLEDFEFFLADHLAVRCRLFEVRMMGDRGSYEARSFPMAFQTFHHKTLKRSIQTPSCSSASCPST